VGGALGEALGEAEVGEEVTLGERLVEGVGVGVAS